MDANKQKAVLSLFGYDQESDASFSYHFRPSSVTNFSSRFSYYDQPPESIHPAIAWSPLYPVNIGILQKGQIFSSLKKKHADEAARVYNYLISRDSFDDFHKAATFFKSILNEGLYLYALSVALAHREDAADIYVPPQWQINPHSFFPNSLIKDALTHSRLIDGGTVLASEIRPLAFITGTNRDPEFKISWWREDIGFNLHHSHWHQVYPWSGVEINGELTNKEREGELFYYMHQQMLARYDTERLAAGLLRTIPFADWNSPLLEGYDSHMTDYYGSNQYGPRPSGMVLADNYLDPSAPVTVDQQQYNYRRLMDAINTGKFLKEDGCYEKVEIDRLGAAVEASISSPNPTLYGSVHNLGHDLLSIITDPDGRFKQAMGVMGDPATAVRDPVFFRWHKFIDDLFFVHKSKLDPYSADDLRFNNIKLEKVQGAEKVGVPWGALKSKPPNDKTCVISGPPCSKFVSTVTNSDQQQNVLTTRMEDVKVDISESMFLSPSQRPNSEVTVTVHRVNHDEFCYTMSVTNNKRKKVKAAFRVFMAPSFDEHGQRLDLNDQRRVFIEMDKFVEELPLGNKEISRSSTLSSVVKPPDLTIADIVENVKRKTVAKDCNCRRDRYCECGWPPNMLLPRGTEIGMKFDLFVMVTDWASDNCTDNLDQGTSYCGVRDKKYPDGRAMGFPFDRRIDDQFLTKKMRAGPFVDTFVKHFDNMFAVPITISYKVAGKSPKK